MARTFTEADGRRLAVDMMRQLAQRWNEDGNQFQKLGGDLEDGAALTEHLLNQEPDVLRRHLQTVQEAGSADLERGFLCVLSEYLGSAMNGAPLSPQGYEKHLEARHG